MLSPVLQVSASHRRRERRSFIWGLIAALVAIHSWAAFAGPDAVASEPSGSAACRECHAEFHQRWASSQHGISVRRFDETVARELPQGAGSDVREGRRRYRVECDGAEAWVVDRGRGASSRYPIEEAVGGRDLFYFLTTLAGGRRQVLPVAWDVHRREWFNPASSAVRHVSGRPSLSLHWEASEYTFNASCYLCHVSHVRPLSDEPASGRTIRWDEPGISCETCHGPGRGHIEACRSLSPGQRPTDLRIAVIRQFSAVQVNDLCAPCHARRVPLAEGFSPGAQFFDYYDLTGLEDPDFHADGRERGEGYTFTSWRANACAQSGQLSCVHCHTSSGRYRFPPERANDACLPCHADRVRDVTSHSHHPAAGEGSRCVSCHLPRHDFARFRRHDHSFRPPAPRVAQRFGGNCACTDCHHERSLAWAEERLKSWRVRDYQAATIRKAELIQAARDRDWTRLDGMTASLQSDRADELHTASLARLLAACPDARKVPALVDLLNHESGWVRSAAASALEGRLEPAALLALGRRLTDPCRAVRVQATMALAGVPGELLGPGSARALETGAQEFETAMGLRVGDAEAEEALGHFWLKRGDALRATGVFERRLVAGPESAALRISAATARLKSGDCITAERHLQAALALDPRDVNTWFNWIVFLERTDRSGDAVSARRSAMDRLPRVRRIELDQRLADWDRTSGVGLQLRAKRLGD